ncbi:MAG: porin [Rhodobacteraceae bacterium]|nr:porin [Paracoccaceae bacterium]
MRQNQKKTLGLVGAALLSTAMTAPALHAQSADQLRSQVFALEQRLSALEKQGGVKVPSGTTLQFGGYVKLDFIYDMDQAHGDLLDASSIGVGPGNSQDGGFRAIARQSRFNLRSTTQTANGPVVAFLEFDFSTNTGNEIISNSTSPRMRHAYGEWNGILAGQTWSNFMPIAFIADTVDFGGPVAKTFIRQAQLRYTFPENNGVKLAMSLENAEFTGRIETAPGVFTGQRSYSTTGNTNGLTAEIDDMPDFTITADWTNGVQRARVGGLLRHLNAPNGGDDAIGYGVNFALASPLWAGATISGMATYGDGIGRYMVNGVGQDAVVDLAGNLHTIQAWGAQAQVMQALTDTVSAGVAYSYYQIEDTYMATDTDNVQAVHATLYYKPNSKVRFGAEFIWAQRELANNASDSISRLQGSVQFNF